MQRTTAFFSFSPEIMITGIARQRGSAFSRASSSIPFMSGIRISTRMTSNPAVSSNASPSAAEAAVLTLWPCRSNWRRSRSRLALVSSITRIRPAATSAPSAGASSARSRPAAMPASSSLSPSPAPCEKSISASTCDRKRPHSAMTARISEATPRASSGSKSSRIISE